ncbi:hypothetical protein FS749_010454 [Ceratobasidium sp. UAMH 11750]|nr:hypothetical protein FS749_010454 [Ceratobasidium sp. UAMH 11750]
MNSITRNTEKPFAIITNCAFVFEKVQCINMDVAHSSEEGPFQEGAIVFCAGDPFFLPDEEAERINGLLPPATVIAIGVVKNVIDRSLVPRGRLLSSCFYEPENIQRRDYYPNTKRFTKFNP